MVLSNVIVARGRALLKYSSSGSSGLSIPIQAIIYKSIPAETEDTRAGRPWVAKHVLGKSLGYFPFTFTHIKYSSGLRTEDPT